MDTLSFEDPVAHQLRRPLETTLETTGGKSLLGRSRGWLLAKIDGLLNYGLTENSSIRLRIGWPLLLLPIALINQLLAPHPVWIVLFIVLAGLYGVGYGWLRHQQQHLTLTRTRDGEAVAAGDPLTERFEMRNESFVPVLWAAVEDYSALPGYNAGRVVACSSGTGYKWQTDTTCGQRGIFRLGPSAIRWGDPFGLFYAQTVFPSWEQIVIYPRIAQLPEFHLPYGSLGGARQLQHPLIGSIRSASVRLYQPGDTLRHVHWPATARHRNLMVTELDAEHGGEVWIVVDLNQSAQAGDGEESTLEYGIVVAASLAAQLINSNERLAVGLLLAANVESADRNDESVTATRLGFQRGFQPGAQQGFQAIAPQSGQAQFWEIMGALAMARAVSVPLGQLLQSSRSIVTSRQSIIVITPDIDPQSHPQSSAPSSAAGASVLPSTFGQGGRGGAPSAASLNNGPPHEKASDSASLNDSALKDSALKDGALKDGALAEGTVDKGLPNKGVSDVEGAGQHDWLDELVQSRLRRRNSVILIQHGEEAVEGQSTMGGSMEALGKASAGEVDAARSVANSPKGDTNTMKNGKGIDAQGVDNTEKNGMVAEQRMQLLAQHEIGCTILQTSNRLTPIITRTRVRREVRTTPMGGAVTVEIEEEMT